MLTPPVQPCASDKAAQKSPHIAKGCEIISADKKAVPLLAVWVWGEAGC